MLKDNQIKAHKNTLYAGIIWIISAVVLIIYGTLSIFSAHVPGVASLVKFLSSIDSTYIYVAAFISILIEGLYVIGSFFPGSSLIIIMAILSQVNGPLVFSMTILLIFVGWCISGAINIYIIARMYKAKFIKSKEIIDYEIKDRVFTTWYPSFRASYEVAQVAEGGDPFKVFLSSLRVRFLASLFVAGLALFVPFFFDINQVTNKEGRITILIVAAISLTVGMLKIRKYMMNK
ncbi:MAG TPA: hypothetical protein VEC13_03040 [Candidatus Paceibacterota bacterium]|nr:hypothetical protein [Candidatus Paceibacterota bacterium]